ncbi:MAG: pilus assembly FimT family protein [Tsuneonella suprasediminis]
MSGAGDATVRPLRAQAGFTLIEALVVLAILALAAGVAFPSVEAAQHYQAFSDGATRFEAALRGARAQALRQGVSVHFTLSTDRRAFSTGDVRDSLPHGVVGSVPNGAITFYPDGTATGGEVAVGDQMRARRWRVRATTGLIERVQ